MFIHKNTSWIISALPPLLCIQIFRLAVSVIFLPKSFIRALKQDRVSAGKRNRNMIGFKHSNSVILITVLCSTLLRCIVNLVIVISFLKHLVQKLRWARVIFMLFLLKRFSYCRMMAHIKKKPIGAGPRP